MTMKTIIQICLLAFVLITLQNCCSIYYFDDIDPACSPGHLSPIGAIDVSKFNEGGEYGNSSGESTIGFQLGVDFIIPVNDQVSAETGLRLARKGSKSSFGDADYSFEDKVLSTYVDIPLLARYKIGQKGFSVYGGLQPSVLLGAKRKSKVDGSSSSQKVTDQYKTLDLAGSIGVGYQLDNGIKLNLGYDHGFVNISKNNDFGGSKINNRTFKLMVGYVLPNKRQ